MTASRQHSCRSTASNDMKLSTLRELHRTMVLIRVVEERIGELVESGEIGCPCHLYIGQEAIAAGVCSALGSADTVWGTHRSHGHYLARGGSLKALFAEVFGKSGGCSRGRGGSMHLIAAEQGVLGSVPIVAATIPLAVGAGLASKLRRSGAVSVAFFGDGATEEGSFHEALNFAVLHKLPVVFVCENNLYASHMALFERRAADNLHQIADFYAIPGIRLDGNDVEGVRKAAMEAVARARDGDGPSLLECRTYRWRGHVGPRWDMDVGVKRKDELDEWIARCPISLAERRLLASGSDDKELAAVREWAGRELAEAERFARQSPAPDESELLDHVFCDHHPRGESCGS
jgi:acetoin:2,6-dichlorophenolindophenol oxidoreductase subunit alpha